MKDYDKIISDFEKFLKESDPVEINKIIDEVKAMNLKGPTVEEYFEIVNEYHKSRNIMSKERVIKISVFASPNEAGVKIREFEIEKETPKYIYIEEIGYNFSWDEKRKGRIKKEEFGEITHGLIRGDMIYQVYAQIYCYESERDKAKKRLFEFATAEIQKRIDAGNAMMQKLEEIL